MDYAWLFPLILLLHVASTSNKITLGGDQMIMKWWVVYYRRGSCKNSDNQITTDIQLSLTDCEWSLHLMLRLHVASTSNETTLVGDHMKIGLLPTGIIQELRQSFDVTLACNSTSNERILSLNGVISFAVVTSASLTLSIDYLLIMLWIA